MKNKNAILSAGLSVLMVASLPSYAQESFSYSAIEKRFNQDGMDVEFHGEYESDGALAYSGITTTTPGYIRSDGWFISPSLAGLGPAKLYGATNMGVGKAILPNISFPVRGMNLNFHSIELEDIIFGDNGILSSRIGSVKITPATITGSHAMFASVDDIQIRKGIDKNCIDVNFHGLAVDMKIAAPIVAKDFYEGVMRGDVRAAFTCDGDDLILKEVVIKLQDVADLIVKVDVRFNPIELASAIVQKRTEMNALFLSDSAPDVIEAADKEFYAELGDLIQMGDAELTLVNTGIKKRLYASFGDVNKTFLPAVARSMLFPQVYDQIGEDLLDFAEDKEHLSVVYLAGEKGTLRSFLSPEQFDGTMTARAE